MKAVLIGAIALATAGLGAAGLGTANLAQADEINVEALMTPTDKIKMGFADGSKHFVLMVRREGETTGSGPFAGAKMVEHGWHDINPPVSGAPHGYLEVTAVSGDIAYLKWSLQVDFGKNGGKMAIMNRGVWQLVSGTGQFAGQSGVGTLEIRQAPEGRRLFVLTGEVLPQP